MIFKSRKTSVFVVLALLVVVQIVFSGVNSKDTVNKKSAGVLAASANGNNANLITEEEVVSADLNVVYRSTLTSTEAVDELEENIDKGDFDNKIVSYTCDRLCVYEQADASSAVTGVMYSGSEANIVERGAEWTKITSGNVTGYVHNVDVLFGNEAQAVAEVTGSKTAVVNSDGVSVLANADEASEQLTVLSKGNTIDAYDECNGYILVIYNGGYGYIDKNKVSITYGLSTAITIDEEKARKAAEEEAAAKRAAEEAAAAAAAAKKYASVSTTSRGAFSASADEIHLLAAIVYWEAGWEPAEGQLAVANVVLNRVMSSTFVQNSITSVVYAAGQFAGVSENGGPSARFQAVLNKSNDELNQRGCYDAAVTALSGKNNIGNMLFFISVGKANYARYTQYTVMNNHCFYVY